MRHNTAGFKKNAGLENATTLTLWWKMRTGMCGKSLFSAWTRSMLYHLDHAHYTDMYDRDITVF